MALAVITINNPSPAMDKQAGEVAIVHRALALAAHDIRRNAGGKSSGTITDGGVTLGTWTYTAVAST